MSQQLPQYKEAKHNLALQELCLQSSTAQIGQKTQPQQLELHAVDTLCRVGLQQADKDRND